MMFRSMLRPGSLSICPLPKARRDEDLLKTDNVDEKDHVKMSQCWSFVSCRTFTPDFGDQRLSGVLDESAGVSGRPTSLLDIFSQVETSFELIPPVGAQNSGMKPPSVPSRPSEQLAPRTMRLQSDQTLAMNVLSDLVEFLTKHLIQHFIFQKNLRRLRSLRYFKFGLLP